MPIDPAQPRVFAFTDRGRNYTMTCKHITKAMWLKYFVGIVSTSETKNGETTSTFDSTGARLELLESALTDATGYTKDGAPIADTAGWQSKLPLPHRLAAANMLVSAEVTPPGDEDEFELGFETVTLRATWTAVDGAMQMITGLKHLFSSPSAAHQVRYSRAMSRSVVSGGRNGQTRWLGSQDVLIELYDELIVKTEGYVWKDYGESINAREAMDAYHKVAAAGALFTPVEVDG